MDWELVFEFWNLPEREFQYLALDYLHQMKKWFIFDDMEKIKKLIVSKSWWDTVDALDELVGHLLLTINFFIFSMSSKINHFFI
ncbi:DNA alkylation repair protein [Lactococcus lactis]